MHQIEGETGLPSPKEAGQRETILVRMDDFPKVFQRFKTAKFIPLKDSVVYWRLQADATIATDSKFSISNLVNIYLVDVNKVRNLRIQTYSKPPTWMLLLRKFLRNP